MTKTKPFTCGRQAHRDGLSIQDNPFFGEDASNWDIGFRHEELDSIVKKSPKPDYHLLAQAQNLCNDPKCNDFNNHEICKYTSLYQEAVGRGEMHTAHVFEMSLRQYVLKAKLQIYGEPYEGQ